MSEQSAFIIPYMRFNGPTIPDSLIAYKGISAGAKLLWGKLAKYAGKNGDCYPPQDRLARDLGVSVRQIQRYLDDLEDDGFIVRVRPPKGAKGTAGPNHYRFLDHPCLHGSKREVCRPRPGRKQEERQCQAPIM